MFKPTEYKLLNKMLDDAISGEFAESSFDESELSKLQSKLMRYLTSSSMSEKKLRESIDVVVAGRVAESILGTPTEGAESDFRKATDYATRLLCGGFIDSEELAVTPANAVGARDWERIRPRVNALIAERKDHVMKLLTAHKDVLGRVVDELVSKGILFAEDVDALLNRRPAEGETRGGR